MQIIIQQYQMSYSRRRRIPLPAENKARITRVALLCEVTGRRLYYSQTPLHGHPVITDSLLCSRGKKAFTFSLNSTLLIRTLSMAPSVSVLTEFDCILQVRRKMRKSTIFFVLYVYEGK